MNRQHQVLWATALVVVVGRTWAAPPPPPTSLNNCQNAVKTATKQFVTNKAAAIGGCFQAVSTQIVKQNATDASAAAQSCVTQFRKLNDSRGLEKQLSDKLAAAIMKKCAPGQPNVTHTLADIIGSGAGVPQPLDAENLNAWCTHYGGDGSIDTLQEWIDCLAAAAECDVDSTIASQYPRALEWLNAVRPSMQALSPPATDPTKITDAVVALDTVKAEIDGPDNNNVISIQCGGVVSTGTAVASSCLAGATFSNDTAGGLTGTMPNNGAVTLTPSTTDQTIALGYHNGAGKCVGDPDLVPGNIKSGVSLFGVAGTLACAACGNATIDVGEQCDQGNLNGQTCVTEGFVGGTLKCGASCALDTSGCYAARFVDNADGTITDNQTVLQWEKKVKLDGTTDFTNLQDADNSYAWAGTCAVNTSKYCQPTAAASAACTAGAEDRQAECVQCSGGDGTCSATSTVWTWLVALNAANFAAHSDWRLPKLTELQGLVDYADASLPVINAAFQGASCGASCTDITSPACACTRSSTYWSATAKATIPTNAFFVNFGGGNVVGNDETVLGYVRAVRSGS